MIPRFHRGGIVSDLVSRPVKEANRSLVLRRPRTGACTGRTSIFGLFICGLLTLACTTVWADQARVDELLAATKSSDEATQIKAINDLGMLCDASAVPTLDKLLRAKSPVVRGYAAWALGKIGAPAKGCAEGLMALIADENEAVRRQAVEALIAIRPGPKVGLPIFIKLMQDSDPGVRMRVLQAVADAKGRAVGPMVDALKSDGAAYWACIVLRDIGPDAVAAVPALVDALKDPRPEIRREATLALAAIGSPDAAAQMVPLLTDPLSRVPATYALGALGIIPANAEPIIRKNAKSDDKFLSTVSLWALALVHPEDLKLKRMAITELVAGLKDEDPFVRTAAARALASLPPSPEIAGPIFEKALAGADETTTHYMLDAIAGQGPKSVPRLIKALEHESLRGQVAYILGQIGPASAPATNALAKLLSDEDPNVGIEAAHALAKIGPGAKAAAPALIAALEQTEGKSRYAAAYALGAIGPDAAAAGPALVAVIEDSDNSLSLVCAWSLVQIRGTSAETAAVVLPELIAGLQSSVPESREAAAETLGSFGRIAKSAVPQLERAAKDNDQRVRAAASQALEAIRG